MIKKEQNRLIYFQFDHLAQEKSIKHFISTRKNNNGAELNLSLYNTKNLEQIIDNRRKLAKSVNVPFERFVFQQQVHSNNVRILTKCRQGCF